MRKETVGARLRRLRGEKGLSQRDVAVKCERVTYAYISRIEAGARTPSVRAIREMAAAIGVTAHFLEHGFEDGVYVVIKPEHGLHADDDVILTMVRDESLADELAELIGGTVVFEPVDDQVLIDAIREQYSEDGHGAVD